MSPQDLDWLLAGGVTSYLQPVVDLVRGSIAGYEALARFPGGPGPLEVFGAARAHGRAVEVEAAALRAALITRATLPANTFLTVNVGPDVIDAPLVREIWSDHPSLAGLVIEITEHVRVESYACLEPILDELRSRGAMIAVDDAGAGYAGLQHLLALRPHFIKLDRELISGLDRDEAKRSLVDVLGGFADRIDAWLIAEGVETEAELDVLLDLRVPLAQGFHLAKPAPVPQSLAPDLALRIAGRSGRDADSGTLRALLEQAPAVTRSGIRDVQRGLREGEIAVVVDEHGHPVATVDSAGTAHAIRRSGLRVNLDTPTGQAAQRAIVRSPDVRFQPLVCTDSAGRYVGIVRIERLIEALARTS
ncbi:MAG: EAL domain-containing protein [Nocardioides sp.]